jgi:hypothetical protein
LAPCTFGIIRYPRLIGGCATRFFFSSPNLSKNALSLPLSFSCGIELAPGDKALRFVLADEIEARFKNGVLSIILPKSAQTQKQTKKIEVKVDQAARNRGAPSGAVKLYVP